MTPYEAYRIEQERVEQQDAIANSIYLDGMTDGAFGYRPQYCTDEYLKGYCEGVKQLRHDSDGRIVYYQPQPETVPNYDNNPF
jgi:hypothetical protein